MSLTVFSPEFTGQRAKIISHDHTPHLECIVIVTTKRLLHVVQLSTKHLSMFTKFYIQSPDSFLIQAVQVAVKNMLVLRWNQRGTLFLLWQTQRGPLEAPKGTLETPKGTVPFGKVFFFYSCSTATGKAEKC